MIGIFSGAGILHRIFRKHYRWTLGGEYAFHVMYLWPTMRPVSMPVCVHGGAASSDGGIEQKQHHTTGMIHPEQRRTVRGSAASAPRRKAVSKVLGMVLRSRNASPPNSMWPITYSEMAASNQVPPPHAIADRKHGKQQEHQEQHERHMDAAQDMRGHDGHRGIQMK